MGTGIKACPIKAPTMDEPIVAPALTTNPVSSDNFLVSVLKRFENILKKALVMEPAASMNPTIGRVCIIYSIDLERMALLERS